MATSLEDCIKIEAAIKKAGTIFGMGHGLLILLSYRTAWAYTIFSDALLSL